MSGKGKGKPSKPQAKLTGKKTIGQQTFGGFPRIDGHTTSVRSFPTFPSTEASSLKDSHGLTCSWFIGPQAENGEVFRSLIDKAIDMDSEYRKEYFPGDPTFVDQEAKETAGYKEGMANLNITYRKLLEFLRDNTTPFYSLRYKGHMNWETTLPAKLGYFAGMLQNPNNVSVQGSTAAVLLELQVGEDLCAMVGYPQGTSWAHITSGGSVANSEAMWQARETRYLTAAVSHLLTNEAASHGWPADIKDQVQVTTAKGETKSLSALTQWEIINVPAEQALGLASKVGAVANPSDPASVEKEVNKLLSKKYSVNAVGLHRFFTNTPQVQGSKDPRNYWPSSKHYSWPKASCVMGLGYDGGGGNGGSVFVDAEGRMIVNASTETGNDSLESKLLDCAANQVPVVLVVSVFGSTEEASVDSLVDILALRDKMRSTHGLDFHVAVDAAWGGYTASVIRKDYELDWPGEEEDDTESNSTSTAKQPVSKAYTDADLWIEDTSKVALKPYVINQIKAFRHADSITIDPHKMGYIQYPAGSILYQDKRRLVLTDFSGSYIITGDVHATPNVGTYGLEGSKPGASSVGAFMSHAVIRPSVSGHGRVLNRSFVNARLFNWYVSNLDASLPEVKLIVLNPPPAEFHTKIDPLKRGVSATAEERQLFNDSSSDINIINYMVNPYLYNPDGSLSSTLNTDPNLYNEMNAWIFEKLSLPQNMVAPENDNFELNDVPMMISKTTFHKSDYGPYFVDPLVTKLGLDSGTTALDSFRSVVMDPWALDRKHYDDGSPLKKTFFEAVLVPVLTQTLKEAVAHFRDRLNVQVAK